MRRVQISEDCWTWRRKLEHATVPRLRVAGREVAATHVVYFVVHRRWPETSPRRLLVRLCGNLRCVRPRHLEVLDPAEVLRLRFLREGRASWVESCQCCGRAIRVKPSHWRRGWARYCSRTCALRGQQRYV
jgi:hypothetical protein